MPEISSTLQSTSFSTILEILLNPFVSVLIGGLTIFFSFNHNRSSCARERLDKVYGPLFLAIEPFLYRKGLSYDDVSSFISTYNDLEQRYHLLINPSLYLMMHQLSRDNACFVSDKDGYNHWFRICRQISKEYDKLCRQSYLPVRSIEYRLHYQQYSSKLSMFLASAYLQLPAIIIFTLALGIVAPPILFISYGLFFIYLFHAVLDEL